LSGDAGEGTTHFLVLDVDAELRRDLTDAAF
jgi:hypothetical protein